MSPAPLELNGAGPALEQLVRDVGLDPDHLAPADAWAAFRAWSARPVRCDRDVLYVQIDQTDPTDELRHLTFIRHLELADESGRLEPIREIAVDLGYAADPAAPFDPVELSSLDYPSREAFLAAVEERADFRRSLAASPVVSALSWSEL